MLKFMQLDDNSFAGTIPSLALWTGSLNAVGLSGNDFEGSVPESLAMMLQLHSFSCADTWVEGSLPRSLGLLPRLDHITFRDVAALEGTIPATLARMFGGNVSVVLGRKGTSGHLPRFSGTVFAVSAFQNTLTGNLPALRVKSWSRLVLHGNRLSCMPPNLDDVKPALSIALLGNHFKAPRVTYPPWIFEYERGNFFTVSNKPFRNVLLQSLGGMCLVALLLLRSQQMLHCTFCMHNLQLAHLHDNVNRLIRMFAAFLLPGSCVTLLLLHAPSGRCVTVLDHLRLNVAAVLSMAPMLGEVMLAGCLLYTCEQISTQARLSARHSMQQESSQSSKLVAEHARREVSLLRVWMLWFLLCCCISSLGATYSLLKAVPGFLTTSKWLSGLVTQSVFMASSFLTLICLPWLASKLQMRTKVPQEELLSIADLLSLPVLPGLVTFIFGEGCLGYWSSMWKLCTETPSPLQELEHILLPHTYLLTMRSLQDHVRSFGSAHGVKTYNGQIPEAPKAVVAAYLKLEIFHEVLIRRRTLCGRNLLELTRCLDCLLERSTALLLGSFVHMAFTGPVAQHLRAQPVKLHSAWVHVVRVQSLVVILAPSMPLLLIFGLAGLCAHKFLVWSQPDVQQHDDGDAEQVHVPRLSMRVAVGFAALLQCSVLAAATVAWLH